MQAVQFAFEETLEIHHRLQNLAVFLIERQPASIPKLGIAAACGKRPLILNSSKLSVMNFIPLNIDLSQARVKRTSRSLLIFCFKKPTPIILAALEFQP